MPTTVSVADTAWPFVRPTPLSMLIFHLKRFIPSTAANFPLPTRWNCSSVPAARTARFPKKKSRILFNQRQSEIIRSHEEELYNRACEGGSIKIFENENTNDKEKE